MVLKFIFRPHSPNFNLLSLSPQYFPKPLSLPFSSTKSFTPTTVAATSSTPSYGPSLQKGYNPSPIYPNSKPPEETHNPISFNEENFTRVFDLAALRVPSEHCFALESRLRGHLLNWPRIRNIARVPGDEIDDELRELFDDSSNSDGNSIGDDDTLVSLNRRIYGKADGDGEPLSPVLYRDKLSRTFNSKGYVKFRNLAKISRPKKGRQKKKEEHGNDGGKKSGNDKNGIALVQVVEAEEEECEGGDMSGLLGYEFKGVTKWRGSTRLLLLDETYVDKRTEDLPAAIKALFEQYNDKNGPSAIELVKCKLTLFYNYWQMNEVLETILPEGMIVPSGFETIGHIAHLNLKDEHLPYKNIIAKVVLDKNKKKVQTVVNKVDIIQNDFRTMQLEVLAGNHSLVTTVIENGLRFHVDLATVYWNSRLSTERQRLLNYFTREDVVCDVFAGVGPIALSAARKVKCVYANDLNPCAVDYLERNCVLNKLERKIKVFNMDGRRFIDTIFASEKARPITQVVMNLPNDAAEFLDVFRGIFRRHQKDKEHPLPRIYVYGFSKAPDPEFDIHERIRIALSEVAFEVDVRKVRLVAPGKWMLCASFILPHIVAYAKNSANLVN
ncbi:OLC1v1022994C4 [Oldenlandia corymbosa var. corymbosa]|uniref:tRNA (guanine(37)-N1)-methyltransferase n=1 Tax=Oldenlandia corymbosa var. corymbosa TaxID=529605 RepID=A0AAV1BZT3_OLDCO|nr:OLC1v1022994C4 [Oldenlandia corymbosa var. corymbosa]